MYALHLQTGNLLDVFEKWEHAAGPKPEDWFYSMEFPQNLAEFADTMYGGQSPVVRVAAQFYRKVFEDDSGRSQNGRFQAIVLADNVRVIDCQGDIHALLRWFRTDVERPDESVLARPVTAIVRHFRDAKGSEILEFPHATTELLRHAKSGSQLRVIIEDFEQRNIGVQGFTAEQVVQFGMAMLKDRGLVHFSN